MTAAFYDQLAPYYHLLYDDWESSIAKQGEALAKLLQEAGVVPGDQVLDAASGIGTQTLGLLARGYKLTASDISAGAIERLRVELSRRALQATAHVDDLRTLSHTSSESMAAVIAATTAFRTCFRTQRFFRLSKVATDAFGQVGWLSFRYETTQRSSESTQTFALTAYATKRGVVSSPCRSGSGTTINTTFAST